MFKYTFVFFFFLTETQNRSIFLNFIKSEVSTSDFTKKKTPSFEISQRIILMHILCLPFFFLFVFSYLTIWGEKKKIERKFEAKIINYVGHNDFFHFCLYHGYYCAVVILCNFCSFYPQKNYLIKLSVLVFLNVTD